MKYALVLLNLLVAYTNGMVKYSGSIQFLFIPNINGQQILLPHKGGGKKRCFVINEERSVFSKSENKWRERKNILKGEKGNNPCAEPRLRFAPSPTGFLHVGGCRTFLYNYILAKQLKGSLILRLEDTDVERNAQDSFNEIVKDLRWLNLSWDEGPDVGGAYGPYKQSEKIELYKKIAHEFVNEGKAYFCFCTKDELSEKKEKAKLARTKYTYDRACRDLSHEMVKQNMLKGKPYTIRFKSPIGRKIILSDILKNEIVDSVNEDFIILRSDSSPTYNFSASVDDHLMRISHVIRGVEHISNTFKQILVLEALRARIPLYAHVPVITTVQKKKISKRNNEYLVRNLREEGFKPDCVINYMGTLGWGSVSKREFYTLDELIASFDLRALNKSALVFDIKKLKWMNKKYLLAQEFETYVREAEQFLIQKKVIKEGCTEFVRLCIRVFKDDVHNYEELGRYIMEAISYDHLAHPFEKNNEKLKKVATKLCHWWEGNRSSVNCNEDFFSENFDTLIGLVTEGTNMKKNEILLNVRFLLTFQNRGVPFVHLLQLWALAKRSKVPNYVPLEDRIRHLTQVFTR
ncbi:glutamate--tRNA ligase, putative [Plasmodium knowlesi strain H]|uniref:glutamate--tRNA ligase n=3 Tax=Plasmodium knowlesi TaxID=5850 RepID=A0A5K1VFS1_PLAKH|nr:glutamate--tRNA ligase, putative [Plasmodium knowlesi strain H]OTN64533.1 putative Glutamate--tRNA ligase [Plasmodium knowlesi]CAA9988972.1 glutamate--tRNA ligase, putative [Plasmodium knowlesi strain H]SBO24816.1 glutamate--tRNA ligase, putative [Plasmodium knowlesi strain H]SBO28079.1 glutamate--tRNA ligase, putative [Plasmodium knowlesi strain H]VVS78446.1 glutamate--tRNA ligase, putative [Plasmodium knowlesi strain H]|eukprot:XP_002261320.1 glutamate--tRNA ligase, putative [Plasmodium knowlesi strain H]